MSVRGFRGRKHTVLSFPYGGFDIVQLIGLAGRPDTKGKGLYRDIGDGVFQVFQIHDCRE